MAHHKQTVIQPVRFWSFIRRTSDPCPISGWIIASPEEYTDNDGNVVPAPDRVFELAGNEPFARDALEAAIQAVEGFGGERLRVRDAYRLIARDGTFRSSDWVPVKKALASRLPDEVKKEIQSRKLADHQGVYILREEQIVQEFQLLRCVALIFGALAGRKYSQLKKLTEMGNQILSLLRSMPNVPMPPRLTKKMLKAVERWDSEQEQEEDDEPVVRKQPKLLPMQEHREKANNLVEAAFYRALHGLETRVEASAEEGTRLLVEINSLLQMYYVALLANSTKQWKECRRRDCHNVFAVEGTRNKEYCAWYCGHLESVRRGRAAKRKKQIRK